jgi:ligand-binding SRPBCC domain-containing protein
MGLEVHFTAVSSIAAPAEEVFRWHAEPDALKGRQFRDVQISGPFRRWDHTHLMIPEGPRTCRLEDRIVYELPFGWIGKILGAWFVRRKLEKLFRYRQRRTAEAMAKRFRPELPT